ncbi:MAG: hypothetical protein V5A57_01880 [Candidatus Paceibacterota bacterium]
MKLLEKLFKNNAERSIAILLGVVILSLGMVLITLAWTPPSQDPPGGNVAAPLNVSGAGQAKAGKLGVQTDLAAGSGYDSNYGLSIGSSDTTDDGLKVSGPIRLDPNDGNNNISGVNKITVNQVDPVYKVGEEKYATYMADFIGLKAEVVGESELEGDKKIIDLAAQEKGSDLWLFWNIVKENSIKPFVTPQGPASLYADVEGSELKVKSMEGKDVSFSFRLIGTRVDYDKKSNLHPNQNIRNYINANK